MALAVWILPWSTAVQQPHLEGSKLWQAVHALVLVLAADEAAKGVHKHGAARPLLQIACRAHTQRNRSEQVTACSAHRGGRHLDADEELGFGQKQASILSKRCGLVPQA